MTETNDPTFGVITDESFERSRSRIGVPQPRLNVPHNLEVSRDGVRHFAYGYGDDNPLYCDEDYAAGTRWGGVISPPTFLYTMGEDASPRPVPPENKAALRGDPFAGLGSYQAVMEFEWWCPLMLGDRLRCLRSQVGVLDKRSDFGGRAAHVTHAFIFANQNGELHAVQRGTWVNAERHTSRERKKEHEAPVPYKSEHIAEIDAAYAAESRRGAEPRWFEDVNVGDAVEPKVKGPLTTTNIIVWHLGWGMQLTPPGNFRLSWKVRQKAPGLYPPNSLNVPDTVQRLHWEPERARELGLPTSYDYGGLRETWLCHLLTDWMGDDAWLWRLECQHRRFNFIGDTSWLSGEVVEKVQTEAAGGVRNEVHLNVRVTNQRGVVTTPGKAVVLLPSREIGPVVLPRPPASTLEAMLAREIERLAPDA
jgi:acyl dehydratase